MSVTHTEWAEALAERLIVSGDTLAQELDDARALALAWALKERAVAAWSSVPSEVGVAAKAINALLFERSSNPTGALRVGNELAAIAAWVDGIAELTRGGMNHALGHLDRAADLFTSLREETHAAHAQVPKIMALAILGRVDEASAIGNRLMDTLDRLGETNTSAKVSLNLGNLHCQNGRYAEAIENFAKAKKIFLSTNDYRLTSSCEIGLAEAYSASGDFERAQTSYEDVRLLAVRHGLQASTAITSEGSALLDLAKGDYATALRRLNDALKQYEALDMPQYVAMTEKQLGDIYAELRLWPEALALYDDAIPRLETLEMPVEAAWAKVQKAKALVNLARPKEAVDLSLTEALRLFEGQQFSTGRAAVQLARAELALSIGEATIAIEHASAAKEIFAEADLAVDRANCELVIGHALLALLKFDAAGNVFFDVLERAREFKLLSIEVRGLIGVGLSAARRHDSSGARLAFETAVELFENQRRNLPSDDLRTAFMADHLLPYRELLRLDLESNACSDAQASFVFQRLEMFRARALAERLGETALDENNSDSHVENRPHDVSIEISHQRAHLNWLYRRARALSDEGEDAQLLREQSCRLERELLEKTRRFHAAQSDNAQHNTVATRIDPTSLMNALGSRDAIIEYGVLDDELFACVMKQSGITVVRSISKWSETLSAIKASRFQIETMRYGFHTMDRHRNALIRKSQITQKQLYDLVWTPLEKRLSDCNRVLVVPHDRLGAVQFAALYDGATYLGERFAFAFSPSAQIALRGFRRTPRAPLSIVALGESRGLVNADAEANLVAALFSRSRVLVGEDANTSAFIDASCGADVLHLACHGEFRMDNPMFSALQLVDAPFTVSDAERLSLNRSIVTLSACESGLAQYARGDEVFGLVRGFLIGGASRVVASLWPVDDTVAMQFMKTFYSTLQNGVPPAIALQKAQRCTMAQYAHPFYWAAFTLYGGW